MKVNIEEIKTCTDCDKWRYADSGGGNRNYAEHVCCKKRPHKLIGSYPVIPSWCPLPNWEDIQFKKASKP